MANLSKKHVKILENALLPRALFYKNVPERMREIIGRGEARYQRAMKIDPDQVDDPEEGLIGVVLTQEEQSSLMPYLPAIAAEMSNPMEAYSYIQLCVNTKLARMLEGN